MLSESSENSLPVFGPLFLLRLLPHAYFISLWMEKLRLILWMNHFYTLQPEQNLNTAKR